MLRVLAVAIAATVACASTAAATTLTNNIQLWQELERSTATTKMPLPFTRSLALGISGEDVKLAQLFLGRFFHQQLEKNSVVVDTAGKRNRMQKMRACFLGNAYANNNATVAPTTPSPGVDGVYGPHTASCVRLMLETLKKTTSETKTITTATKGVVDASVAAHLLHCCSDDRYRDDGTPARAWGKKYKIHVPVHRNRSVESVATLFDADNIVLLRFRVRAHGHSHPRVRGQPYPYPEWDNYGIGLNQFTSDGATPTGLSFIDLNTREANATMYGPYPINRVVFGVRGNAATLLQYGKGSVRDGDAFGVTPPGDDDGNDHGSGSSGGGRGGGGVRRRVLAFGMRSGILLHTSGFIPPSTVPGHPNEGPQPPMLNSAGCMHAHPDAICSIASLLVKKCGVTLNENPMGGPVGSVYPYDTQGIISVELVD
jgi:hypothetical protein